MLDGKKLAAAKAKRHRASERRAFAAMSSSAQVRHGGALGPPRWRFGLSRKASGNLLALSNGHNRRASFYISSAQVLLRAAREGLGRSVRQEWRLRRVPGMSPQEEAAALSNILRQRDPNEAENVGGGSLGGESSGDGGREGGSSTGRPRGKAPQALMRKLMATVYSDPTVRFPGLIPIVTPSCATLSQYFGCACVLRQVPESVAARQLARLLRQKGYSDEGVVYPPEGDAGSEGRGGAIGSSGDGSGAGRAKAGPNRQKEKPKWEGPLEACDDAEEGGAPCSPPRVAPSAPLSAPSKLPVWLQEDAPAPPLRTAPASPPTAPLAEPPIWLQKSPSRDGTLPNGAALDLEERRIDEADGEAYTVQEFLDEYGDLRKWEAAPAPPGTALLPDHGVYRMSAAAAEAAAAEVAAANASVAEVAAAEALRRRHADTAEAKVVGAEETRRERAERVRATRALKVGAYAQPRHSKPSHQGTVWSIFDIKKCAVVPTSPSSTRGVACA